MCVMFICGLMSFGEKDGGLLLQQMVQEVEIIFVDSE